MTKELREILERYAHDVLTLYGQHLQAIILYGSYARGDNRLGSDIDIMILVDLDDAQIEELGDKLSDLTFDYNYDNDLMIMPIVKNIEHFNYWIEAYPFYRNVKTEGVPLYAA